MPSPNPALPKPSPSGASAILFLVGCVLAGSLDAAEPPALKDVFANDFLVGTALNHWIVAQEDHPARALVATQFNCITPGNALKWGPYNPQPGVYRHEPVDELLTLAAANHQSVVGHVLFWHQQTPPWVFADDSDDGTASRATLLARMQARVHELVQRYGDRIPMWDVVNEAYLEDGSLRKSPCTRILGDDFIPEAFRIAQAELPPSATLIYNDYNMYAAGKRAAVVHLIATLRARGLRIDAVGMQAHWGLVVPALDEVEASLSAFAAAGVRVHITELDIDVLPRERRADGADLDARRQIAADSTNNPYPGGLPAEIQEQLKRRYAAIFALFVKHQADIDRVTFWGVTDADSWLNHWPIRGRTNYPLLFDRAGRPKPAFDAVIATARGES